MIPDAAISAFAYLRAVQAGDAEAADEFAAAEPRLAALLVDAAMQIVFPVTALPGPDTGEACADTFALEALGRVLSRSAGSRLTTVPASEAPSTMRRLQPVNSDVCRFLPRASALQAPISRSGPRLARSRRTS